MGQRQDRQAPSGGEGRGNLYEEVTARVVAELEQGRVPGCSRGVQARPRSGCRATV